MLTFRWGILDNLILPQVSQVQRANKNMKDTFHLQKCFDQHLQPAAALKFLNMVKKHLRFACLVVGQKYSPYGGKKYGALPWYKVKITLNRQKLLNTKSCSFRRRFSFSNGIFPDCMSVFRGLYPSGNYITYLRSTPPPSNSHHQDYYTFSTESLKTFICHCYWVGGRSNISHQMSWENHQLETAGWQGIGDRYLKGYPKSSFVLNRDHCITNPNNALL